jgi:mannitol-1-phosphate/altronate dehydrogenase
MAGLLCSRYPGILSVYNTWGRDNDDDDDDNFVLIYVLNSTARDELQSQHEYKTTTAQTPGQKQTNKQIRLS